MSDSLDEIQEHVQSLSDEDLVRILTEEQDVVQPETLAFAEEEAGLRGGLDELTQLVAIEDDDYLVTLAHRGDRFLAQLIDVVAIGVAIGLGAINGVAMAVALVVVLGIFQIYLLSAEGQTIGKTLMKIRIVDNADESNPGFWRAFGLREVVIGLLSIIPFFSLVDVLFIFREDYRCIHDHIAGTKVIEDR